MSDVSEAVRIRTQKKLDSMPPKVRAQLRAILHQTSHLLCCTPMELVDEKTQQHKWHRDKAPKLGGPGCTCKPMIWNDCVV